MIDFQYEIWKAFRNIRDKFAPRKLDILTGFFGVGASKTIEELGVKDVRMVFGLRQSEPALPSAQIKELERLAIIANVRVASGLHAKLYLFDEKLLAVGSANFSKGGFGSLREVILVTDNLNAVRQARAFFDFVWNEKSRKLPSRIRSIPHVSGAAEGAQATWQLGTAGAGSNSPFGKDHTKGSSPKIRLVAFQPKWFEERKWFDGTRRIRWSATNRTLPGDVHIFCASSTLTDSNLTRKDPRVQAVHSIWRAASRPQPHKGWDRHYRAYFEQPVVLDRPVPMRALKNAKLLTARRSSAIGWPMNISGKLYDSKDAKRLAQVLSQSNPKQRKAISLALLTQ